MTLPSLICLNKDDLIRLAPGIRLNLKPCRYYQNIFAFEPRLSLAGPFYNRKGWYWRRLVTICSVSPPRIKLKQIGFKFPIEEAGLEMRESAPLESFCQT